MGGGGGGGGRGGGSHCLMPELTIKSALLQVLMGVHYLHENWILHLDLKPDNLLVQTRRGPHGRPMGVVKITDFGLARIFKEPARPLSSIDKGLVVTLWYRSPELLLHAKHFTPAIDVWSVGCIFAETIGAKVLFKGNEFKHKPKAPHPFQSDQCYQYVVLFGLLFGSLVVVGWMVWKRQRGWVVQQV